MASPLSRNWFFPFICMWITLYFIYHGIEGNHGIQRMKQVQQEIKMATSISDKLKKDKELLQAKVNALSPKSLDLDQLEESALRILNMGDKNAKIIFK